MNDINIYDGRPRSGKSEIAVNECFKLWKQGIPGYSCIPLTFEKEGVLTTKRINYFSTAEELNNAHDCWILIDEDRFVENRDWQNLPKSFYFLLNERGHFGIDFYITCVNRFSLDVKIDRAYPNYYNIDYIDWLRFPHSTKKFAWFHVVMLPYFPYFKLISKLWTKKMYDSYLRMGMTQSTCQTIITENGAQTIIS